MKKAIDFAMAYANFSKILLAKTTFKIAFC